MNCQRTSSLLSAYLDRELTGEEMLLIRGHLAQCPTCDNEYEALRMVKRLLGALSPTEADAAWMDSLTELAVTQPAPWERLRLQVMALERRLLADDAGVLRGRRLARSLALSALALFLVAAPFAQRESPVVTGAMGPVELRLRPVWQPPMTQSALAPALAPVLPPPLPLSVSHSFGTGGLSAPTLQLISSNGAVAAPRTHSLGKIAPWSGMTGNYLTFSNLER